MPRIELTLNGEARAVDDARRRDPARGHPRGLRRDLAQGRLLADGPVRLLHRARRRPGQGRLRHAGRQGRRPQRASRSRASTSASATSSPAPSPSRPAVQCGFCIPGIVVRAHHILKKTPLPTRAEIAQGLGAHLCRCTGYVKIVDAIELASQRARRRSRAPRGRLVGQGRHVAAEVRGRGARRSAIASTSTTWSCPTCCTARVVLSAHPRARVRGIDLTRGARAARRARHRRRRRRAGPALAGAHLSRLAASSSPSVRRRATPATSSSPSPPTRGTSRAAPPSSSRSTTRCSTPLTSTEQALAAGAPLLHPENGHADNVLSTSKTEARRRRRGAGRSGARGHRHLVDAVHRARLPRARVVPGRAARRHRRRWAPARHCTSTRRGRASTTTTASSPARSALQADELSVTLVSCGGAFGGKEDLSIQAQTALLASVTGPPGQADDRSRRVDPPAPQAPPDRA